MTDTLSPTNEDAASAVTGALDQLAITQLIASYGYDYDEGRLERWLERFTDDVVVTAQIKGATLGVMRSKAELLAFVTPTVEAFQANGIQRRHNMGSIIIDELTATTAKARSYLILNTTPAEGPTTLVTTGKYVWDLVKQADGRWLIASYVLGLDNPPG